MPSFVLSAFFVLSPIFYVPREANEWPHWRGPTFDGCAGSPIHESLSLELAWKTRIGSAYSGIVAGQGAVISTGSDGVVDFVIALDATTGRELWRSPLGSTYRGHDGSKDGPLSTPCLGQDRVFVLGPRLGFHALDRTTGEEIWKRDLVETFGASVPEYGAATSPILFETPASGGDLVILHLGGEEGHSLGAFDVETGELVWHTGRYEVTYQSPVLMPLDGETVCVVLAKDRILVLDPGSGRTLASHDPGPRSFLDTGLPTPMGDGVFCVPMSGDIAVMEMTWREGEIEIVPRFKSRELGNTYASPIFHDDHLYGFRSDFLSCIDAKTGRRQWKSRPPGGRGLILVGNRLAIAAAEGDLVLAKTSPRGYVEEARIEALSQGTYAWPAYANGMVYVRDFDDLAAIRLVSSPEVLAESTEDPPSSSGTRAKTPVLDALFDPLEDTDDPRAVLDAWFDENPQMPIVENGWVHFFFRDDVDDVAIAGNMVEGRPEALERIPGTSTFYRSYRIEPGARWEYRFQLDFQDWVCDPKNPRQVPSSWRVPFSEVLTREYRRPAHLDAPKESQGSLETYTFESRKLQNEREIRIYLPRGYADSSRSYPVMIVHQGLDALKNSAMDRTLDNLIGNTVAPCVVVFLAAMDEWWFEGGGSSTEAYLEMLVSEFLPDLSSRYRLLDSPKSRALLGRQNFGMTVALAGLLYPEVFGKIAIQSLSLGDIARYAIFDAIERQEDGNVLFYVDWNLYSNRNVDRGFDAAVDSRRLTECLRAKGYRVIGGEALDGFGWGSFAARQGEILESFFPLQEDR